MPPEHHRRNEACIREKLILPYFENKPINKITPKDIRAWQNELIGKEYSNSYLDRIQNMMTALFNYAVAAAFNQWLAGLAE